jgi:hypothetical protein
VNLWVSRFCLFAYSLLDDLGVLPELKTSFVRKPGVRFIDRDGKISTTWCFNHVIKDETYVSFQVIRGEFDHILLRNAARHGAVVKEEAEEATAVDADIRSAPDRVRVTVLDSLGQKSVHEARFLIDASGREAFIGAGNGWRQPRAELDRTAIWSHWGDVELSGDSKKDFPS